jgi:L,D-peptidoglycan transpeptidase YkuD (ErfK/YbiS/YcfS/YnhG family)
MHILINKRYLTYNNYKVKCAVGKKGIGYKKKEGDLITPIGHYKIKFILYRKDRVKKIKSSLKKIIIRNNMGWCDDPRSKKYNQLIYLPSNYKYEKLFKGENVYDVVLVLNYNMAPIKKNKGSAIFIHVASRNFRKTEGCVAIKKNDLLKMIEQIKTNTKIKIVNQR